MNQETKLIFIPMEIKQWIEEKYKVKIKSLTFEGDCQKTIRIEAILK